MLLHFLKFNNYLFYQTSLPSRQVNGDSGNGSGNASQDSVKADGKSATKLSVNAQEFVPQIHKWNSSEVSVL